MDSGGILVNMQVNSYDVGYGRDDTRINPLVDICHYFDLAHVYVQTWWHKIPIIEHKIH